MNKNKQINVSRAHFGVYQDILLFFIDPVVSILSYSTVRVQYPIIIGIFNLMVPTSRDRQNLMLRYLPL